MHVTDRPSSTCPICGKAALPGLRPFCGIRCADADLGRWLTGQYRLPGPCAEEIDDEREAKAPGRGAGA